MKDPRNHIFNMGWLIHKRSAVSQVESHVKGSEPGKQSDVDLARPEQSKGLFPLQSPALRKHVPVPLDEKPYLVNNSL